MNHLFPMLQQALRDWRLAEARLLMLALTIAVMATTSVSFFTHRIDTAMQQQATRLFGADLIVKSSRPLPDSMIALAQENGLQTATAIEFPSVVLSGEASQLVQVQAIGGGYPLRGEVRTSDRIGGEEDASRGVPAAGQIWTEPRVLYALQISPGDALTLGEQSMRAGRVITFNSDSGGSAFDLAPKLMMNIEDLSSTGLLTPASRASFRLLVAGDAARIQAFRSAITAQLTDVQSIQTAEENRPQIVAALGRASQFLNLASILTIVLSGAAIALATLSYTRQESRSVAVMKTLGATRSYLHVHYGLRFLTLLMASVVLGSASGFVAHQILASLLAGWIGVPLPPANFLPVIDGVVTALLTLAGFALLPLSALVRTPSMHILRNQTDAPALHYGVMLASVLGSLFLYLGWQSGDARLALAVLLGVIATLALMLGLSWLLTRSLRRPAARLPAGVALGMANIARYKRRSSLLIASFGTGLMALLLLSVVRADLLAAWERNIPADAPNHFLINIQPDDLDPLKLFLTTRAEGAFQLYPMIRGRLTAINDVTVNPDSYANPRAERLASREFNLSSSDTLPEGNELLQGKWFDQTTGGLSVEADIAETLGFKQGDLLSFDIAGQQFAAPVTSIRKVDWDSMQPNFFVIAESQAFDQFAATWITSLHVRNSDTRFTSDLVRQFPGITVLDVRAILQQVRSIINQASAATQYVFAFSLLAGIVVLMAAIQTQRQERRQEIAILKTLGASRLSIRQSVAAEFLLLGGLAGLLGAALALIIGWILGQWVFDLDYRPNLLIAPLGMLGGMLLLGGVGLLVIRGLLNTLPTRLLQSES